jgi:hypothetical protein
MVKDIIHEPVKNALIKDGWTITADPYQIEYEELRLFADISAKRAIVAQKDRQQIVIEIKSFVGRSFTHDLQQAIGQCVMYRIFMDEVIPDTDLFIATSKRVYDRHFQQKAIQFLIRKVPISLIIVDIQQEEIVAWINLPDTNN